MSKSKPSRIMGMFNNKEETESIRGLPIPTPEDTDPRVLMFLDAYELFEDGGKNVGEDLKILEKELTDGKITTEQAVNKIFGYGHLVAMSRILRAEDKDGADGVMSEVKQFKMVLLATKMASMLRSKGKAK